MKNLVFIGFIALYSSYSYAELPLTVENFISGKGKITTEIGTIYSNTKINNTKFSGYSPIQISDSSFINIPNNLKNEQLQQEILITTFGIKYGLLKDLDTTLRTNILYNSNRFLDNKSDEYSTSNIKFSDISFGLNYQFLQDTNHPALIGFLETTLLDKTNSTSNYFSNWSIGITTYHSYDPIVLSLTTGYKYSLPYKDKNNDKCKLSDLLFINPQIAFAANDRISLIAGLNFKFIDSQEINSTILEKKRNNLDYSFGVGFGVGNQSNINILAIIKQDFNNSSEIRLNYNYKFL